MRRRALTLWLLGAALASGATAAARADAGPRPRVLRRRVRPPEGSMRRGAFDAPAWGVYLGGGAVFAAAVGGLLWAAWRRRR